MKKKIKFFYNLYIFYSRYAPIENWKFYSSDNNYIFGHIIRNSKWFYLYGKNSLMMSCDGKVYHLI